MTATPEPLQIGNATLYLGDCLDVLRTLPDACVQTCVTSPPYYGLRDYGHPGQIGLEPTPDEYIAKMVEVFHEVRRVLRDDGTLWLNLGDSYAAGKTGRADDGVDDPTSTLGPNRCGLPNNSGAGPVAQRKTPHGFKPKDLIGIPWRVALALQADGWYLRQDIIWHKPNPMPESVTDRCTKAHEYLFLLSKAERYFYDGEAVKEPSNGWQIGGAKTRGMTAYATASGAGKQPQRDSCGGLGGDGETRNRRSVWTIATQPYSGAHFAVMPPALVEPCILAGSAHGDLCLDPFMGSGTTAAVACRLGRRAVTIDLNADYHDLAIQRITAAQQQPDLFHQAAAL